MKTIAIANQKGGCGKTTTTVNLSAALAASGRRVLLIDLDPQAHASFALRADNQPSEKFVYNVLTDDPQKRQSLESCTATVSPNFDMVPSNIQLSTLEQELKDKEGAASQLYKVLSASQLTYEYILIDCPPSLGFLTFNALRAADWVIIPIDMSPFTLVGVGKLLGMIELVQVKIGHVPRVSALATLFDRRTTYSQGIFDEIRTFFGDRMLGCVIRHNVALKRAVSEGISIMDFDGASTGARDYLALCEEILRLDGAKERTAATFAQKAAQTLVRRKTGLPSEDQGQSSIEADIREMAFTIDAPTAKDIYLVGDFNDWNMSDESKLTSRENGCWEKRVKLARGIYRYQFVVDGEWTPDSKNGERERNPFGTFDSVIRI